MARTVKHFSLHRLGGTELRVVSDLEVGILPVIEVEEAVIRGYTQSGPWPHHSVTLFLLDDLEPLVGQLDAGAQLPPGGAAVLQGRPVVNAYDLADLASCHLFMNWRVMQAEGYAEDPGVVEGLLAHEHAHPLSENATTAVSRGLEVELAVEAWPALPTTGGRSGEERQNRMQELLTGLAQTLCLYAPREVFASELAVRRGFGEPLLELDRRNLVSAQGGLAGREQLRQQLEQQVRRTPASDQASLSPAAADLVLLIGDLQGYVDLGLEEAAFYRAGQAAAGQDLRRTLEAEVFPHLQPEAPRVYTTLRDHYLDLRSDMTPGQLLAWGRGVLGTLTETLGQAGLEARYSLHLDNL